MIFLDDQLLSQLKTRVLEAYPNEAVGLILSSGKVVSLPNHSDKPTSGFEIHKSDIAPHLGVGDDLSQVVLWHSHPKGGVGPSRVDMTQKTPLPYHLVVSLVEGDIVPTWY